MQPFAIPQTARLPSVNKGQESRRLGNNYPSPDVRKRRPLRRQPSDDNPLSAETLAVAAHIVISYDIYHSETFE
jgi:hypothetical protein